VRHSHADNDPLNKTDPLGLRPCDKEFTVNGKKLSCDDIADAYVDAVSSELQFSFLFSLVNVDPALSCAVTEYLAQCTYAVSRSQTDFIHNASDRLLGWDKGRLFSIFCSSSLGNELSDVLGQVVPYVNGLPRGCADFLRAVPGDFRRATSDAYKDDCLAVTLMLERPDPDDPVARYIGSQAISVEIGQWGTKGGRSCRPGPSYGGLVDDVANNLPEDLKPFAAYVRGVLGPR
jgi:hypothetical protein